MCVRVYSTLGHRIVSIVYFSKFRLLDIEVNLPIQDIYILYITVHTYFKYILSTADGDCTASVDILFTNS